MLGTLHTQLVVVDTVNKGHIELSEGADGREMDMGGIPQRLERGIGLEGLAERLCTL